MEFSQDELLFKIEQTAQRTATRLKSFGESGCILILLNYQCEQAMAAFGVRIKEICSPSTITKGGTHTKWETERFEIFGKPDSSNIPSNTAVLAGAKMATASAIARSPNGKLDRPCKSNCWTRYGLVNPSDHDGLAEFTIIKYLNTEEGICDHSLFDGAVIPKAEPWLKIGVSVMGGSEEDIHTVQSAAITAAKCFFTHHESGRHFAVE